MGTKKFTLLMNDYQPENIADITTKWEDVLNEDEKIAYANLTVQWKPQRDHSCSYEVAIHSTETDSDSDSINVFDVPIDELYEFTIQNLPHDTTYNVAITAKNMDGGKVSEPVWKEIESPHCPVEFCYKDLIYNVNATFEHLFHNTFNINVTWTDNRKFVDYFIVEIKDKFAHTNGLEYSRNVSNVSN
jgi:hypothetical protein